MTGPRVLRRLAAAVVAVAAFAACGDGTGPRFQPNVLSSPDSFRLLAPGLDGTSDSVTYTWSNPLDSARVTHLAAMSGGTGTLIIRGPGGAVLYQASVATSGTFGTARGVAGAWEVEVRLVAATGTFEFKVEPLP